MKSHPMTKMMLVLSISVFLVCISAYIYMRHVIREVVITANLDRTSIMSNMANAEEKRKSVSLYSETMDKRDRIYSCFFAHGNDVGFIESLEKLGVSGGSTVKVSSIKKIEAENENDTKYDRISAEVEVNGPWSAVMRTISLAESMPHDVKISDLRLDTSLLPGSTEKKRGWRATFDVTSLMSPNDDVVNPTK